MAQDTRIKLIEQNIQEILEEGKEFNKVVENFNIFAGEINHNYNDTKIKKAKLLNILLKYPKRKMFFEWGEKESSRSYSRNLKIGVNENGLGIVEYGHNLSNIDNDYVFERFIKLFQNGEFKKLFFEHVKEEDKPLIEKLLKNLEKQDKTEAKNIDGISIILNNSYVTFRSEKEGYYDNLAIIDNDLKERNKDDNNYFLNDVTEKDISMDFDKLTRYVYLLRRKDKIMAYLKEKQKEHQTESEEIKKELDWVTEQLKPYEALEKI